MDFLSLASSVGISLFGLAAGLTSSWIKGTDYIPWLPKGFRLFQAHPYSLIAWGAIAALLTCRLGFPGIFVAGAIEAIWEIAYTLQSNIIIYYPWDLYLLQNLTLFICFYVVAWTIAGRHLLKRDETFLLFFFMLVFATFGQPVTFSFEALGEIFLIGLLLILKPWKSIKS